VVHCTSDYNKLYKLLEKLDKTAKKRDYYKLLRDRGEEIP